MNYRCSICGSTDPELHYTEKELRDRAVTVAEQLIRSAGK